MIKKKFQLGIVLTVFAITALACGFSFSTANFGSATMARDAEGNRPTSTFSPEDTFYAVVELQNAPDDTTVRAEWTAVDVQGEEENTPIDSAEITTGSDQLHFTLENNTPWPAGSYKVDLYIDGELEQTLEFQVEG